MTDKKTILIVEDDVFLGKLYESFFEKEGYNVYREPEGEQGLYRMQTANVDLVLLDIIMPKKTGFDVLIERKKDPELKKIPVIILTNLEQEEDKTQAMELGADDYFTKTEVDLDLLLHKVHKLLKHNNE